MRSPLRSTRSSARLAGGGRLVYAGAGPPAASPRSTRPSVGPTFGSRARRGRRHRAARARRGGRRAIAGAAELAALGVGAADVVVGVSASGTTPYTLAALEAASAPVRSASPSSACRQRPLGARRHELVVVVGPEVVAGSTRLKAGTAQKLVLNTISTVTMIRLGRTYAGLMVGVAPENAKLRERARRNVLLASGAPEAEVDAALAAAGGDARVALVALLAGVDPATARERLESAGGSVRLALGGERHEARRRGRARRAASSSPATSRSTTALVVDVGLAGGAPAAASPCPASSTCRSTASAGVDFLAARRRTTRARARRCSRPA